MAKRNVFISYAHVNKSEVKDVINKLTAADISVWFDEFIRPGSDWDESIEGAIKNSDIVLVFLSKAAVESKNVKQEYSFAIDEKKTIIPVFLESLEAPFRLRLNQSFYLTENKNLAIQNLILKLQSADGVYKALQPSVFSKLTTKAKASLRYIAGVFVLFVISIIYLVFFTGETESQQQTTQTQERSPDIWEATVNARTVYDYYNYIEKNGVTDENFIPALDSLSSLLPFEGYVEYRSQNDEYSFFRAIYLDEGYYYIGEDYKIPQLNDILVATKNKSVYGVADGKYIPLHDQIIGVDEVVRVLEVLKYQTSAAIWLRVAYSN